MLQGLNKFLRAAIIVLLILLAVLSVSYKYNHCSTCKFDYEGEEIKAHEFMDIYFDKCLRERGLVGFNVSIP